MEEQDSTKGIRILSLDGGGPGCFSQLVILDEIMGRIAHDKQLDRNQMRPADYFDLMGGVGFGAYIGFMLGALRMTVKEAMKELHALGSKLRMDESDTLSPKDRLDILREEIREVLKRQEIPIDVGLQDERFSSSPCKVALLVVRTAASTSPQWLSTYPSRQSHIECSVVDALSASIAIPTLFGPVSIGLDFAALELSGAHLAFNNPTRELLKEARRVYGDERQLSVILSLGSGKSKDQSLGDSNQTNAIDGLLKKLIGNSETTERDLAYQLYDVGGYIRLNVDHGLECIQLHEWSRLSLVLAQSQDYLALPSITKLVDNLILGLIERQGVMTLNQLTRTTRIKRQAKAPPAVSPYFVMRKEGWAIMEQKLLGPRMEGLNVFVISGMGGCGKTQMVSYFVQKYHDRFKYVFFVDASSESSIKMDLQSAIQSVNGHQQDSEHDAISFLESHVNSLLIFDNADNPKVDLVQFFPRSYKGIILITTRVCTLRSLSTLYHLKLGPMSHDEAIGTMVKAAGRNFPLHPNDVTHASTLIEELGHLALALVQAGIYISNMVSIGTVDGYGSVFEHYLDLFRRERAILMRKEGSASLDRYRHGVYAALDLSYTLLPPLSKDLLHLCSQLHYTNISVSMILAAANVDFEDGWQYLERPESHHGIQDKLRTLFTPNGASNEAHVHEMVQSLVSLSLLQTTMGNNTVLLRFHPLVHSWAYEMLSSSSCLLYTQMAITVVSTCSEALSPAHVQYLPPHIIKLMKLVKQGDLHVREMIEFGVIMRDYGFGRVAVELHEEATKRIEAKVGSDNEQILDAFFFLGGTYETIGRLKEAEKIRREVLTMCHKIHGEWHPDTISASNNLAL
ncbi:FabD/lysophospholipase-like protein, partial [Serendipita vermifera]